MSSHDQSLPAQARRRERRVATVRALRIALPGLAGLLLLACAVQVALRGLASPPTTNGEAQASKMSSPRFSGKSRDGRTYVVTGREGMRDQQTAGLILIAEPVLTLRTKRGRPTTMRAKTGVYDEAAHTLLLRGDVRVDDGSGARFAAERAVVDTHTGAVSGQSGLRAQSAAGQVQSQDYTVLDEGDRMILRGGVRGRITPRN